MLNADAVFAQLPQTSICIYINRSEYNISAYAFTDLEQPERWRTHTGLVNIKNVDYGLKTYSYRKQAYVGSEELDHYEINYREYRNTTTLNKDTLNEKMEYWEANLVDNYWDKMLVEISDKQDESRRMTILFVGVFDYGMNRGNLILDVNFEVGLFLVTIPKDDAEGLAHDYLRGVRLLNPFIKKL
jgi:hypothetical protein